MYALNSRITVKAPAKINLTLHITGKLDNGYHTLKSVMQSISLCDELTVSLNENKVINVTCSDPSVPTGNENIAYKAAEIFFKAAEISDKGADIHIEKRIPSQAGMGGGSADGAAVLYTLNKLCGEPLNEDELYGISASVGADVPFCLKGGTVLCEGIGEIMTPLSPLPDCFIVIGKGSEGISTRDAFEKIDSCPEAADCDFDVSIFNGNIRKIASHCSNAFSKVSPVDDIRRIRGLMLGCGALCSVMTGSGSAVFGIFTEQSDAMQAQQILEEDGYFSKTCVPLKNGVQEILKTF